MTSQLDARNLMQQNHVCGNMLYPEPSFSRSDSLNQKLQMRKPRAPSATAFFASLGIQYRYLHNRKHVHAPDCVVRLRRYVY